VVVVVVVVGCFRLDAALLFVDGHTTYNAHNKQLNKQCIQGAMSIAPQKNADISATTTNSACKDQ
jgi:hypothetical protein